MNDTLKQIFPGLLVAIFVAAVVPRLTSLAPLFATIAVVGWIMTLLWVLTRAEALPRPLMALARRLAPARRIEAIKASERQAARARLVENLRADAVQAVLDDALIGQTAITAEVAHAIEVFVAKKNPLKPLSIALAGPPVSGRTTFAEGLSAALAPYQAGRLVRVDCASDAEIDFAAIGTMLGGLSLPIVLLDNIDRIGDQRQSSRIMNDVYRLLEAGATGGSASLKNAVVIITSGIDHGSVKALFAKEHAPGERALAHRDAVFGTGRLPQDMLDRLDLVEVLKPLEPLEQVAVVWKTFCSLALREHEIEVVEDELGLGDGIEDFLIAARTRWVEVGVSGVREAARFVAGAADTAFVEASRTGVTRVRARWDAAEQRIKLDPVQAPAPAPASGRSAAQGQANGGAPARRGAGGSLAAEAEPAAVDLDAERRTGVQHVDH
jgi:hypothetical protein